MLPRPHLGFIFWLALFLADLRYPAFAALGLAVGDGIARLLKIADVPTIGGGIRANALLAAMAVCWATGPVALGLPRQIAVAVVTAAFAAILTAAIIRVLTATILPPLIWGYCLVAGTFFLLFGHWTLLAVNASAPWPPPNSVDQWVTVFMHSLGSLIFSPSLPAGMLVSAAILIWSRTLFVTGAIGWLCGAVTASELQRLGVSYYWMPASYNYFIAGMALGAAYFLPGRASLLVAGVAGVGASLFAALLQVAGPTWAFLPVSSGLAIWIGTGALVLAEEQGAIWRNFLRRVPPEEAWWRVTYWAARIGRREPLLVLPLPGTVQISQSFSGTLSHVGQWRFAMDFQRPVPSHSGELVSIWDAPVTAPASGIIERIRDDVVDNPLGVSNYADNWGNYVLVHLDQGGWILLAHLRQGTIGVRPGTRVEIGSYVGSVGNSGRSPAPHLHLQAQLSPQLGARTIPFRLANFEMLSAQASAAPRWIGAAVPEQGAIVTAAPANPHVHAILTSMAPGTAVWSVVLKGHVPRAFRPRRLANSERIEMTLNPAGRYIFNCESGGTLVTVADPDAWRVIDFEGELSALLNLIAIANPSVPYAARVGLEWDEPVLVLIGRLAKAGVAIAPYRKRPFPQVRSVCVRDPQTAQERLVVETRPISSASKSWPRRLVCQFERLRGPVEIEATFAEGSIVISQLSFQPYSLEIGSAGDTVGHAPVNP